MRAKEVVVYENASHPPELAEALAGFAQVDEVLAAWSESRGPLFEKPSAVICRALALARVHGLARAAGSECTRMSALEIFLRYEAQSWPDELSEEGRHVIRILGPDDELLDELDLTELQRWRALTTDPQKTALCARRIENLRGHLARAFYAAADNVGEGERPEWAVHFDSWRKNFAKYAATEMLGWHGGLDRARQEVIKLVAQSLAELLLARRERTALRGANMLLKVLRKVTMGKQVPYKWAPPSPPRSVPETPPIPKTPQAPREGRAFTEPLLVLGFDELPFGKPPSDNGGSP